MIARSGSPELEPQISCILEHLHEFIAPPMSFRSASRFSGH